MVNISESVEHFCAVTGSTNKEKARSLIASCGGDLMKAVNIHLDGLNEKPSKPGKDTSSEDEELQWAIRASLGLDTEEDPYISEKAEEEAYPEEFAKSYKVVWTSDEEEDVKEGVKRRAAPVHPQEDEPPSKWAKTSEEGGSSTTPPSALEEKVVKLMNELRKIKKPVLVDIKNKAEEIGSKGIGVGVAVGASVLIKVAAIISKYCQEEIPGTKGYDVMKMAWENGLFGSFHPLEDALPSKPAKTSEEGCSSTTPPSTLEEKIAKTVDELRRIKNPVSIDIKKKAEEVESKGVGVGVAVGASMLIKVAAIITKYCQEQFPGTKGCDVMKTSLENGFFGSFE